MEDNITAIIAPIKCRSYGVEYKALYKIFRDTHSSTDMLAINLFKLLEIIDNGENSCSQELKSTTISSLSKECGLSSDAVGFIVEFLKAGNYINLVNNDIKLTDEGIYLKIIDRDILSMIMFRYFWEKADWIEIIPHKEKNRFLDRDARPLISLMLLGIHNNPEKFSNSVTKVGNDVGIKPIIFTEELLGNKSINYVLKNIFESLGLLILETNDEKYSLRLTARGIKVFEYYGRELEEEYRRLTEECWECYDRGNFEQAKELAESILSVVPDNMEAYNVIGCVLIRKREYEKASCVFTHAINIFKEIIEETKAGVIPGYEPFISLSYNLGLSLFYEGDFINSLKILKGIKRRGCDSFNSIEDIIENIKMLILKNGTAK